LVSLLYRGNRYSLHQAQYCLHHHKFPQSYQVVTRSGEDKDPGHPRGAAMAKFAQQPHRLQPAEDLFDPFALLLTDLITAVTGGATINGRAAISVVLGHVPRHLPFAQVFHALMSVIV